MKNKLFGIILFLIMAVPVPIAVFSWIGTLITVAGGVGNIDWKSFKEAIEAVTMISFFIFIGMYPLTYVLSLIKTYGRKQICWFSFLPLLHILVIAIFWVFLPE